MKYSEIIYESEKSDSDSTDFEKGTPPKMKGWNITDQRKHLGGIIYIHEYDEYVEGYLSLEKDGWATIAIVESGDEVVSKDAHWKSFNDVKRLLAYVDKLAGKYLPKK